VLQLTVPQFWLTTYRRCSLICVAVAAWNSQRVCQRHCSVASIFSQSHFRHLSSHDTSIFSM